VVVGLTVELDHEPGVVPENIDLMALYEDVRLRPGQPTAMAQVEEPPLQLRPRDRRRPAVVVQDSTECSDPWASRGQQTFNGPQVK
jgi:hypothetical protein